MIDDVNLEFFMFFAGFFLGVAVMYFYGLMTREIYVYKQKRRDKK